jgi:4-hydroxyproline epimerase
MAEKAQVFREKHGWFRSSIVNEPRGHDAIVGALLLPANDPQNLCGVIFFNNQSTLPMCIHGMIGVAETMLHLGTIRGGTHRVETPAGIVSFTVREDRSVSVANVPCYRYRASVTVDVESHGRVTGDVSWGGNWFFLIQDQGPAVRRENIPALLAFTTAVKRALATHGITGENGIEVDHVESFGPPHDPTTADSKNFVLCPGNAYDRSPCGTGTSAKLACLFADGKITAGQTWRQAGILDSIFTGSVMPIDDTQVIPTVSGRAWVTGESVYHFAVDDPFRHGIPSLL